MKNTEMSLRTKQALSAALKEAMLHKSFSKITVTELITACNLNRNTFYYHFHDIYELLKWTLEQESIEVIRKIDLLVNTEEAIRFIMDYIDENKHIINCAYDSIGHIEMKHFFYDDLIGVMTATIDNGERQLGISVNQEFKDFLSAFYTEALVGTMMSWIQNRHTQNREQVIQDTLLICRTTIPLLLKTKAGLGYSKTQEDIS